MAESTNIIKPFECNIQPITRTNTMTLLIDEKDTEFANFLKYTIIKLGGKFQNPQFRRKMKVKSTAMGLKEQAVLMVLQMISQSPEDTKRLKEMLNEVLEDDQNDLSQDSTEQNSMIHYDLKISTIIEEENDDYDSRLEDNKEDDQTNKNNMLLGKRGFELFSSVLI